MIQLPATYIVSYKAINKKGQPEEGTTLTPEKDYAAVLEREGYRNIEIVKVRER